MREPVFTETLQIALVVPDLEAAMETYVSDYGIGPWHIYEFNPDTVSDMRENGEPVARSVASRDRTGRAGAVGARRSRSTTSSVYARFLATNGPGVHHIGVGVRDYDGTLEELAERGHDVVLGGEYNGISFSYLSTDRDLGVITEIFSGPPGEDQEPDAVYPPPDASL